MDGKSWVGNKPLRLAVIFLNETQSEHYAGADRIELSGQEFRDPTKNLSGKRMNVEQYPHSVEIAALRREFGRRVDTMYGWPLGRGVQGQLGFERLDGEEWRPRWRFVDAETAAAFLSEFG